MTDAGADQILSLTAPSTGNDFEFVVGESLTSGNKSGKVFRYSLKLTLDSGVVGKLVPKEDAWATGAYYQQYQRVSNGGNVYAAQTAGVAGATAPTHTSGEASDDTVTWLFVGAEENCYH